MTADSILIRIAFACTAAGLGSAVHAAEWDEYRLSGTLLQENGRSNVIIEVPDGSSVIVGVGDEVGAGQVLEISTQAVRIRLAEGDLLLPLTGRAGQLVPSESLAISRHDGVGMHQRVVPPDRLRAALRALADSAKDTPDESRPSSNAEASIARLFELPPGTRLVAINEYPVDTERGLATQLLDAVTSQPHGLTLTLDQYGEFGRAYVTFSDSVSP